ncbi:hypothetical protein DFS21_107160 [Pseudomonas sp. 2848]|uniref:hypothetical protein n=1 Tax=Pseudomonas sp. 2848 TaxID=2183926 RepID=UPI000DACF82A|nr:hypothetical protein [Pseudomonas sp. 2848]PZW79260.1 hypothetical protein DFS21_107160 [Pseudomonas sp. 2848]
MNVYVVSNIEENRWWVHMDQWRVSFYTSGEADRFVERLNSRLNAPHSLDLITGCSAEEGRSAGSTHQPAKGA